MLLGATQSQGMGEHDAELTHRRGEPKEVARDARRIAIPDEGFTWSPVTTDRLHPRTASTRSTRALVDQSRA
jgi:hypothetical protein